MISRPRAGHPSIPINAEATAWRAGYAEAEVTPRPGEPVMMVGFGMERTARGTVAPLMAQALVLSDARKRAALLFTADLQAFDQSTVNRVRRVLGKRHGLAPAQILFSASHTHWGPGACLRVNFAVGGPNPWYIWRLETVLLDLAERALKDLRPARLQYGATELCLGANRRKPGPGGKLLWEPYPEGSYDTHTPLLHVARAGKGGLTDLLVVGHACHPTGSGALSAWSPDFPGAMRQFLRSELGPRARGLFVQGCGADVKLAHRDPRTGKTVFCRSVACANTAGRKLARAALGVLHSGRMVSLPALLQCRLHSGRLTLGAPWKPGRLEALAYGEKQVFASFWARQVLAYGNGPAFLPFDVQAWRLGDRLSLLGLQGEICSPYGPMVRSMAGTPHAMALGYANGSIGYIPTAKIFREGGYEAESSHRAYFLPAPFTSRVEAEVKSAVAKALRRR